MSVRVVSSANSITSSLFLKKMTVKDTAMLACVFRVGTYRESLKGIYAVGLLKVCFQEKTMAVVEREEVAIEYKTSEMGIELRVSLCPE